MIKIIISIVLILFILLMLTLLDNNPGRYIFWNKNQSQSKNEGIPIGLQHLLKAYPDYLDSATNNILYWNDGTEMIYDDGIRDKEYETLLNVPDLEDQMLMHYPVGANYQIPPLKNSDPGRVRYEPFFFKMYGRSSEEVQSKLKSISWLPRTENKRLWVTSINNVHIKLQSVSDELDNLPEHLKEYVQKVAGTFYWRKINGTERVSTHCFGIAIDINVAYSNYWRWDNLNNFIPQSYKNQIPMEIVEIFEKHGFIWGGKWYHYDTMHFEYRPELLIDY